MTPDARAMEERLAEAGGALEPLDLEDRLLTAWLSTCDCYVDALFGVGLKRPVEGDFLAAVRWMNGRRAPVVSCDLDVYKRQTWGRGQSSRCGPSGRCSGGTGRRLSLIHI